MADIFRLPNELFLNIFQYLSYSDLKQVRLVCHCWSRLASLPEHIEKSKLRLKKHNIQPILKYLQQTNPLQPMHAAQHENLEIVGLTQSEDVETVLMILGKNLKTFRLRRTPLFRALEAEYMPGLRHLTLDGLIADNDDGEFMLKLEGFKQLESLELAHCNKNNIMILLTIQILQQLSSMDQINLKNLQVEHSLDHEELLVRTIEAQSKSLVSLSLDFYIQPQLRLVEWRNLFSQLRSLRELKISGNCKAQWLHAIFSSLPQQAPLQQIELNGMLEFNDLLLMRIMEKWPRLEKMHLTFTKGLTSSGLKDMVKIRNSLQRLNLSYCHQLDFVALMEGIACTQNNCLKHLILQDASLLDESTLIQLARKLPQLNTLNLENCSNGVTNNSLKEIFTHQTKLQTLVLEGCFRISDDSILGDTDPVEHQLQGIQRLQGLKHLNLRGCRHITNRTLEKGLRFRDLRTLKLGFCHKITSNGIEDLVENCPALENLEITSGLMLDDTAVLYISKGLPRLRHLNLSHCINLTEQSLLYIVEYCQSLQMLTLCGIDAMKIDILSVLQSVKPLFKYLVDDF